MTVKQNTGQGGTNGANVTTAGSGGASGDAWDAITLAGAGTLTYSSTNEPFTGHRWHRAQATSGTDRVRAYHSFTAADQMSGRFAFRLRADPGVGQLLAAIVDTAFSFPIQLQEATVSGARHIVLSVNGTQVKDWGVPTYGSGAGDVYWFQWYATKGATGTVKAKLFDETQTIVGTEYSNTSINTGTAQFIRHQFGGNTGIPMDFEWTDVSENNNSPAAYVALPSVSNVAPVATVMARPDPLEPGVVTVTGTITDSDGTVASAAVTIVSGPDNPTVSVSTTGMNTASCSVTATFTAAESGWYVVRLAGTDNTGAASNNSDVIIQTYATANDVKAHAVLASTSWTASGAASVFAAVSDGDTATYAESPSAPSGSILRVQWNAIRVGVPIILKPDQLRDPSGGAAVSCVGKLYAEDGTTLLETSSSVAVGTSYAIPTVTFSGAALTTEVSRRAVITELIYTQ